MALTAVLRAVPAQAEIYAWRDEQGRLVLSERPAPTGVQAQTFAVHGNDQYRTTGAQVSLGRLEGRLGGATRFGWAVEAPRKIYQPAGLGWTLPQGAQVRAASLS